MTKEFYQILGVSETAAPEEIKKFYRKLAQKWHPDKWNTKSVEERKEANKKMQEINKAYEVLSDEDKRARYDIGETNFADSYSYDWREELRRQEEEIDAKLAESKERLEKIEEAIKINKEQIILLARSSKIATIDLRLSVWGTRDNWKNNIDSNLWYPYSSWEEKVMKMEITVPDGETRSKELDNFEKEFTDAVKKAVDLYEAGINNPEVDQARKKAIASIENNLAGKGLKTEDLAENYRNCKEQINNQEKVWEIRSLRDKINENIFEIWNKNKENSKFTPRSSFDVKNEFSENQEQLDDKQREAIVENLKKEIKHLKEQKIENPEKDKEIKKKLEEKLLELQSQENKFQRDNYNSWTREELINEIKRLKTELSSKDTDIGVSLRKKLETQLREVESVLNSFETPNNSSPKTNSVLPIVGVVGLVSLFGGLIIWKRKKKR